MGLDEMEVDYEEADCPTCGAVIPLDAVECPECGQIFEEEEESLWDSDEDVSEDGLEEEWDEVVESEPGKGKLIMGLFVSLVGIGVSAMSWLHNQIEFNPLGLDGYDPNNYGPLDMMVGVVGIVIVIIGVVIILLGRKGSQADVAIEDDFESLEDEDDFESFEDEEFA